MCTWEFCVWDSLGLNFYFFFKSSVVKSAPGFDQGWRVRFGKASFAEPSIELGLYWLSNEKKSFLCEILAHGSGKLSAF